MLRRSKKPSCNQSARVNTRLWLVTSDCMIVENPEPSRIIVTACHNTTNCDSKPLTNCPRDTRHTLEHAGEKQHIVSVICLHSSFSSHMALNKTHAMPYWTVLVFGAFWRAPLPYLQRLEDGAPLSHHPLLSTEDAQKTCWKIPVCQLAPVCVQWDLNILTAGRFQPLPTLVSSPKTCCPSQFLYSSPPRTLCRYLAALTCFNG